MNTESLQLPDLNDAVLDWLQVEALLRDIAACTRITDIIPRAAARQQVGDIPSISLDDARQRLHDRTVRGVQFRYHYDQADWWDTVMVTGTGYRLVRIRHDFAG